MVRLALQAGDRKRGTANDTTNSQDTNSNITRYTNKDAKHDANSNTSINT